MNSFPKPPEPGLPDTVTPEFLQTVADDYHRMLAYMDENEIEEPSVISLGKVDQNGKFVLADPNEVDDDDIHQER